MKRYHLEGAGYSDLSCAVIVTDERTVLPTIVGSAGPSEFSGAVEVKDGRG